MEFNFITGLETKIEKFPTATELWNRLTSIEPVKRLITVQLLQYAKEIIQTMFPSANDFKSHWNNL